MMLGRDCSCVTSLLGKKLGRRWRRQGESSSVALSGAATLCLALSEKEENSNETQIIW